MERKSMIKHGDTSRARDSDQNEDDSILGSDELSDLRFSSQDNLLDSSQDGDNQCDVKWDYTSPQTMRQLRKMRGKYSADDVKKIIAKFPDLPVKSPESSFSNIRIMLPPKNAAAVIEKSRQLRAKQREMKLLRKREKSKRVAQDMILFLHQEQQKQEQEAAEKLKKSSESDPVNADASKLNDLKESTDTTEKSKGEEEEDDCWSDDDLFMDNSFLIEATQNPEKFLTKDKQLFPFGQKNTAHKDLGLNPSRVSRIDQSIEVSTSAKHNNPSSEEISLLSDTVIPSSIQTNNGFSKFPSKQSSHNRPGHSFKSVQTKSSANYGHAYNTNGPFQRHRGSCDNQISSSRTSSLSSSKISASSMKSPLRKSLSFDTSKTSKTTICPLNKGSKSSLYAPRQNLYAINSKSGAKNSVPIHHQSTKTSNSYDPKQTAEQDFFDSSLSDEMLLQATLSQELAIKCGSSQPSSSSSIKSEKFTLTDALNPSYNTHSAASSKSMEGNSKSSQRRGDSGANNITNLLLSPVKPGQEDFQAVNKISSKSPLLQCNRKDKSDIQIKHKSSQGLSSSTPVKCLRSQKNDCSDSFLEKAFEDSFMNDEALFESQILPMLELAESQVQKSSTTSMAPAASSPSHSPIKCSPEEIEVKRQQAIKKRSLRLAQMNHRKS